MSYLVVLSEKPEDRPDWFKEKFRHVRQAMLEETDPVIYRTKPWTWYWNETYEHPVRIRQGKVHIEFESEEVYTWFILKEL